MGGDWPLESVKNMQTMNVPIQEKDVEWKLAATSKPQSSNHLEPYKVSP